jgi:hypothetical protein
MHSPSLSPITGRYANHDDVTHGVIVIRFFVTEWKNVNFLDLHVLSLISKRIATPILSLQYRARCRDR